MTATAQTVRSQLIASLQAKLVSAEAELAKFTVASKAARAVSLRAEIADLKTRISAIIAKAQAAKLDKSTVIDGVTGEVTGGAKSATEEAYAKFSEARDDFMRAMGITSGKRALVAWVSGCVIAFCTGAAGGFLLDALVNGVILLSGSAFLALLAYIIGLIAVMYAGIKLGGAAYSYIANERIDAHYNLVKSWFGFKGTQIKSVFSAPAAA